MSGDSEAEARVEAQLNAYRRVMSQLDQRIGRIARAHVWLDTYLRALHLHVGFTQAQGDKIYSTDTLVRDIRPRLPKGIPREAARSALDAAVLANKLRNRAIHDQWMPQSGEGEPRFSMRRYGGGGETLVRDFAWLDAVRVTCMHAAHRVRAISHAIWFSWDSDTSAQRIADQVIWRLEGSFVFLDVEQNEPVPRKLD